MGTQRTIRLLRKSKDYGKLEILSRNKETPVWEAQTFSDRCAGCHATAVKTETRTFSAVSLDCYVCHGDVSLDHTKDVARVLLSSKNREPRQVVSLCGQCHLRGGKSKSTGLPYPNTFVAGDNLFRDFQVDFSDAGIRAQPEVDQHIWLTARDVALFDRQDIDCLACHDVHGQSTEKHQKLENRAICSSCHASGSDNMALRDGILPHNRRQTHSRICDY